jgi:hypothetical protein
LPNAARSYRVLIAFLSRSSVATSRLSKGDDYRNILLLNTFRRTRRYFPSLTRLHIIHPLFPRRSLLPRRIIPLFHIPLNRLIIRFNIF